MARRTEGKQKATAKEEKIKEKVQKGIMNMMGEAATKIMVEKKIREITEQEAYEAGRWRRYIG